MISDQGWNPFYLWEHSQTVKDLYAKRCRKKIKEMTSHKQAVELLKPYIKPNDTLLDVGCGSGYFYHSFKNQNLDIEYYGIDAAESLIKIGQEIMPKFGLASERLKLMRIEDMEGSVDHVVSINVLSNIDNYHKPLERMLLTSKKTVVLRESCSDKSKYQYVTDKYLDDDVNLKVYCNTYCTEEVVDFIQPYGFDVQVVTDQHTQGKPEKVIDYDHYWQFMVAVRK